MSENIYERCNFQFGPDPDINDLKKENLVIREINDVLYAALKAVEWRGRPESITPRCPLCDCYHHAPDCKLAAALRKAEGNGRYAQLLQGRI